MDYLSLITVIVCAYLIGSIPFGLIFVKILKGHDIRSIESGRTGGTNAGRAAGFGAGVITGVMDFFKGLLAVLVAWTMFAGQDIRPWVEAAAGVFVIIGHNYSIYLMERVGPGKYRLRGGAGGAPCLGASVAMFPANLIYILPAAVTILLGIGYASLTTLSIAFIALIIFVLRSLLYGESWAYVVYAVIAQVLLVIALGPNIKRLISGNERLVGVRALVRKKKAEDKTRD
jgi:glycerol-3-phosphate acyltransferase PlsY